MTFYNTSKRIFRKRTKNVGTKKKHVQLHARKNCLPKITSSTPYCRSAGTHAQCKSGCRVFGFLKRQADYMLEQHWGLRP